MDIKLMEYLQSFSNNVSERTRNLMEKIDDLSYDTCDANVRLRNTFNEFLLLADSQFIENVSFVFFQFYPRYLPS